MKKQIKSSKRGLTFSISPTENFHPGSNYRYSIEGDTIQIKKANQGLKVSRKKVGHYEKALFDLRNKEIKSFLNQASQLEIEIREQEIIVSCYREKKIRAFFQKKQERVSISDLIGKKKTAEIIIPSFVQNQIFAKASGQSYYEQITLMDYFSSMNTEAYSTVDAITEVNAINQDLKQVFDVVSLFSGAGMLDYPFSKDQSFQIKFAVDYEPSACESYRRNIGDHIICDSVTNVTGYSFEKANLIIGGPSCKPFSNANRHAARMEQHEDVDLVNEYIRIVQENQPDVFVIENVPKFISAKDGEYLERVFTNLSDYQITSQIIKDCEIGGYTTRERAIIIGSKIGEIALPNVKVLPMKTVKDALAKVDSSWFNYEDITKPSEQTKKRMSMVTPGHNFKDIPELAQCDSHSNRYKRLDPDAQSPTIVNWRKLPLIHPKEDRTLSVAEAAALMGLDENFCFLGSLSQRQQQCGNGVTYAIGNLIKKTVKKALQNFYRDTTKQLAPV